MELCHILVWNTRAVWCRSTTHDQGVFALKFSVSDADLVQKRMRNTCWVQDQCHTFEHCLRTCPMLKLRGNNVIVRTRALSRQRRMDARH